MSGGSSTTPYMHSTNITGDRIHPNRTGSMYIAKQF